jgi:hypothetical protein
MYNRGISLGELIAKLKKLSPSANIQFDFGSASVGILDSYRGYYDQLALGYDGSYGSTLKTVGEVLLDCESAIGKTFTGWKGGDYVMDSSTSIFIANSGCTSDTYIKGITEKYPDWYVINTKEEDNA